MNNRTTEYTEPVSTDSCVVRIESSSRSRVESRLFYYLSRAVWCLLARRCRQQLIKSDRVWMRVLSISFCLKRGFGVFACYEPTISTGNLLSQVGLARNLASRVAMLLQSDKNQREIRPPLGRRAETGRKEGGEKRGVRAIWNTREKERGTKKGENRCRRVIRPAFECAECKRVHHSTKLTRPFPLSWSLAIFFRPTASTLHTFMQISMHTYPGGIPRTTERRAQKLAWECKNAIHRCGQPRPVSSREFLLHQIKASRWKKTRFR